MKYLVLAIAVSAAGAVGFAQPADSAVTSSTEMTSSSPRMQTARELKMTTAIMERMWSNREQMYKEAGLSEDRIAKLKELEMHAYSARQSGEKLDYAAMREERNKIITPEEQKKLEAAAGQRRNALRDAATKPADGATTPPAAPAETNK